MFSKRLLLKAGEEKGDGSAGSSHGFFSLKEMCLNEFLSREHRMDKGNIKQLLGQLYYDAYKQFKQKKLKSLFEAILGGDPETTLEMIEKYPALLLARLDGQLKLYGIEVKDNVARAPSGHKTTNKTAYQVALAVEDTQLAAKIKAHLVALAGEEAAKAQGHEQFPEGWEAAEEKAWEPIFTQLEKLTQAIRDVAPGDIVSSGRPKYQLTVRKESRVNDELATFRILLDSRADEIMTIGRLFNPQLLLRAFKIYESHYHDYFGGDWSDPRALLFWQRVIGYIQRFLPANYIQAFCDNLYNSQEKLQAGLPQGRSFQFDINYAGQDLVPVVAYPLSVSRLGFDFALYAVLGGRGGIPAGEVSGFSKLMSVKSSRLIELVQHENPNGFTWGSWCAVM